MLRSFRKSAKAVDVSCGPLSDTKQSGLPSLLKMVSRKFMMTSDDTCDAKATSGHLL